MNKLQEAVYFKRIDFNDALYTADRRLTGAVDFNVFANALKNSRITLSTKEIQEILQAAPKDAQGKILYKDFQRQLARKELVRSIHNQEVSSFITEKIATAVNEFIKDFSGMILNINDFFSIIRKSWIVVSPDEIRQVWDSVPHDKLSLQNWARQNSVPIESFKIPVVAKTLKPNPSILVKLKEIALIYGNKFLTQAIKSKEVLFRLDLLSLLEKFRISYTREEFDEFREWAIDNEIMKRQNNDLGMVSELLCEYFLGIDSAETDVYHSEAPVLDQLLEKTLQSMVLDKLQAIKKCLLAWSNQNYIEEVRFREVLKSIVPSFSNENMSLIVNSLRFTIPPSKDIFFRQIYVPEFMSLFDKTDFALVPKIIIREDKKIEEKKEESKPCHICETFLVKPRDSLWEKTLLSNVFKVHKPLLANLRINDYNSQGFLTLEMFHYTLKKSLEWLSNEEINFLINFAIRECGCIDTARTETTKNNLENYRNSESISAVWFPEGEQYNISYLYFILVLSKHSEQSS